MAVCCLDGKTYTGYLDPTQLGRTDALDLLTPEGEQQAVSLEQVKSVYFVREFGEPFELERKIYLSRPRQEGLWLHLKFIDGEEMEGLAPNDLLTLLEQGIQITPPDLKGNCLRVFIPRTALAEFRVLGVVGQSRRGRPTEPTAVSQPELFEPPGNE